MCRTCRKFGCKCGPSQGCVPIGCLRQHRAGCGDSTMVDISRSWSTLGARPSVQRGIYPKHDAQHGATSVQRAHRVCGLFPTRAGPSDGPRRVWKAGRHTEAHK